MSEIVGFLKLDHCHSLPTKADEGSAAYDLYLTEDVRVPFGETVKVPLGLKSEFPRTMVAKIYPRSSAGIKRGISLANTVAIIDSSYRGEWFLFLKYTPVSKDCSFPEDTCIYLDKGDRIAQVIFENIPIVEIREFTELSNTERGEGGLGSTGS